MKIKSFVISISSVGNGETARTIPVSINPIVYGIFSRRTVMATMAAILAFLQGRVSPRLLNEPLISCIFNPAAIVSTSEEELKI